MYCTDYRNNVYGWNEPTLGYATKRRHQLNKLVQPPSTYLLTGKFQELKLTGLFYFIGNYQVFLFSGLGCFRQPLILQDILYPSGEKV